MRAPLKPSLPGPAKRPRPGDQSDKRPSFGLAMRFLVTVDSGNGLAVPLGKWSGCSGLGMSLKVDEYNPGGSYESAHRFPDRVSYNPVTLDRAMDATSSAALQRWLRQVVDNWVNAEDAGTVHTPGNNVSIEMLSAHDWSPIFTWVLLDAIPVGWSGPTLSAKGNDMAMEKLVLAHNGITVPQLAPAARRAAATGTTGKNGRLKLSLYPAPEATATSDDVEFQYNPQKVTVSRTAQFQSPVLGRSKEDQVIDPGKISVSLSDLRVEGPAAVKNTVDKLFDWLTEEAAEAGAAPTTGAPAAGADADPPKLEVKHLQVVMGAGTGGGASPINYRVVLKSVTVVYTRFTRAGLPNRASVSLTLQQVNHPSENKPKAKPSASGAAPAGRSPLGRLAPPPDRR